MSRELESVIVIQTYLDYVKLFGPEEFLRDLREYAPDHYQKLVSAFRKEEITSFNKQKAALLKNAD